ncbi:hypothetical protein ACWD5V_40070 [Streptomyces sp. NPDC002523]
MSYPQLLTPEEKLADAKKLLSLPRIVVICGSTRFMTEMNEADLRETKAGRIVPNPTEQAAQARILELRAEGMSYRAIGEQFDTECLPPRRAAKWSAMTVRSVCQKAGVS